MAKGKKKRPQPTPREPSAPATPAPSASASAFAPSPSASTGTHAPEEAAALTARRERGARLAIVLGTLAAFVGTLDNHLQTNWDDERFLADPDVLHPSLGGLVGFFTEVRFEAYHPLHLLSYWLDVPWVGTEGPMAAMVIHATNLGLWALALLAGFEVMRRFGLSPLAAAVGTLAFGIHPLAVEIVCWASARKDVIAVGLALAATLLHLRAAPSADPLRDRDAWGSRALFLAAALAKTSVLPLPVALVAIDVWLARRTLRSAITFQLPTLLAAGGLGAVVLWVWSTNDMIRNTGTDASAYDWTLIPATTFHLLQTSVWPVRLAALYPLHRHDPVPLAFGLAAVVVLAGGLVTLAQRRHQLAFARAGLGVSWFVLFALPVLNVVPMYFQWQDRYGVLPLFGLMVALASAIDALRTTEARETAIRVLVTAAVVLLPLGWWTTLQVETWSDGNHLFGHATRAWPTSYYAWMKLGEVRRERGDVEAALRAYGHAIEVGPDLRVAHGGFLYSLALRDEARERIAPSHALDLSARFLAIVDDARALRELAGEMTDDGYRDAVAYVLGRSLDLDPVSDERLERAIEVQLRNGDAFMARFYLSRLRHRPMSREVTAFWESERERLGLVTDEEYEAREGGGTDDGPVVIPVSPE